MKTTITAKTALVIAEQLQYAACNLVKERERLRTLAIKLAVESCDNRSNWWKWVHLEQKGPEATAAEKFKAVACKGFMKTDVDFVLETIGIGKSGDNLYRYAGEVRNKANKLTTKLRACAAYGDPVYLSGDEAEFIYKLVGEL